MKINALSPIPFGCFGHNSIKEEHRVAVFQSHRLVRFRRRTFVRAWWKWDDKPTSKLESWPNIPNLTKVKGRQGTHGLDAWCRITLSHSTHMLPPRALTGQP
ncbi:hypothetical protein VI817_007859 [Penicillium citrinum]|nr:hypothetical protein VI817_007859 [Penicillium citrinum]